MAQLGPEQKTLAWREIGDPGTSCGHRQVHDFFQPQFSPLQRPEKDGRRPGEVEH